MLPTIPNLAAHQVTVQAPWTVDRRRPAFDTKDAFRAWCNSAETQHVFFSGVTGRHANIRVSEDNPIDTMHALVLDYDDEPLADIQTCISRRSGRFRPTWVSRTFSNHVRAVWLFERPVPVFCQDIFRALIRRMNAVTHHAQIFTGADHGALDNPFQYYELGNDWQRVPGAQPIPYFQLLAWVEACAEKHRWPKEGVTIPIEALREMGERYYPGRWPGGWERFAIGARGPRFWDESATNQSAAVIRESGVTYFSDGGGFRTWSEIFGVDRVREWQDNRIGAAVADVYHLDGRYWTKNPCGFWAPDAGPETRQSLIIAKGLAKDEPTEGGAAEVDRALVYIREHQRVEAAAPFIYKPDGLIECNGKRFLNTSTLRPLTPARLLPETEDMGFPWVRQYLSTAFATPDDFWSFLAWLRHVYAGALCQDLSRGLALFLAGPASAGKTRLNKAIIGKLMGRSEDAASFLKGEDRFNSTLFESPLWTLDDAVPPGDGQARKRFTQFLKMVVANDKLMCRAMHRSGVEIPWTGRVVVTLNDDPESTQIIPDLEENTRDKMLMLKMVVPHYPEGMKRNPTDAEILQELPYFARWLLDCEIPEEYVEDNSRFGVVAYHNPDLAIVSTRLSETSSFQEVLDVWRRDWFQALPGTAHWEGNTARLYADMSANDSIGNTMRGFVKSPVVLTRHLNKLIRARVSWVTMTQERIYRITRP